MQSRLLAQPIYMYMTCTYTYIHMHIHITLRWGSISPPRTAPVDSRRAWRPPSSDNHVYVSPCICICLRVAWRPPSSDNRATSSTEPRRAPSHVEHRATSRTWASWWASVHRGTSDPGSGLVRFVDHLIGPREAPQTNSAHLDPCLVAPDAPLSSRDAALRSSPRPPVVRRLLFVRDYHKLWSVWGQMLSSEVRSAGLFRELS